MGLENLPPERISGLLAVFRVHGRTDAGLSAVSSSFVLCRTKVNHAAGFVPDGRTDENISCGGAVVVRLRHEHAGGCDRGGESRDGAGGARSIAGTGTAPSDRGRRASVRTADFAGDGADFIGGGMAVAGCMMSMEIFLPVVGIIYVLEALSVVLQVMYFKGTGGKRLFRMAPLHHHFEEGGMEEVSVVNMFWGITLIITVISLILG